MMHPELERELLARPVRALQVMLGRLGLVHDFLPLVTENGVFDEPTLEAVMRIQQRAGLPITGVVDRRTWEEIQQQWERAEERLGAPRPVRAFPGNGRQARPGEWRVYMALPQTMFRSLEHYFNGILPDESDGCHGVNSVENVRWLQRGAGLEPTGTMDQAAWNALSRLYEIFVIPEGVLPDEIFPAWG